MIPLRRFWYLLAAAGGFVLLQVGLDLYSGWRGIDPGTPIGRMRLITLVWSRLPVLLVADLFLVASARGLRSGGALRRLALVHQVVGVLALVLVPVFFTSGGQVALTVAVDGLLAFRIQLVRVVVGLLALAIGAWLGGRALRDPGVIPAEP